MTTSPFERPLVFDSHAHSPDFLPPLAAATFRWVNRRTMPPRVAFGDLPDAGVNGFVASAVGDPIATRWWGRKGWTVVGRQLEQIRRAAEQAGARIATSTSQIREAVALRQLAVVLGLEGADAIGSELDRLDDLYRRGVRLITPVHLTHNQIGTTCLPWQGYAGLRRGRVRRQAGLTEFGRLAVRKMNSLGIVIDLSHCDVTTFHDIAEYSVAPVVATHAGARSVQDFERYLDDWQIHALARSGGVIGLWPYCHKARGVRNGDELVRHARRIADLVGPQHLCLGTDMNGIPGAMAGYRGTIDVPRLTESLVHGGFSIEDVSGILWGNFMRVLDTVCGR